MWDDQIGFWAFSKWMITFWKYDHLGENVRADFKIEENIIWDFDWKYHSFWI
jgi:hypothetical protein